MNGKQTLVAVIGIILVLLTVKTTYGPEIKGIIGIA